jgi:ribosomal-protein-alanine N-acetyltransferase
MWKKFSEFLHGPQPVFSFQPFLAEVNGLHLQVIRSDKSDILALLQLERDIYDGRLPWRQLDFQNQLRRRDCLYLSLYDKSLLVAFVGMRLTPREAHITNISVAPTYQRRGIGSYLLDLMIKKAQVAHCAQVSLEVRADNQIAQRLYRRAGFKTTLVRPGYYDKQHDGLEMGLNLQADRKKKLF